MDNSLRDVRRSRGVTQEQLAVKSGVSRATISAFESGNGDPILSTLQKLADALGVQPADLLKKESALDKVQKQKKVKVIYRIGRTVIGQTEELTTMGNSLHNVPTCELVDELKRREGVKTTIAEPYQDISVQVNGPAIVLVVID